MLQPNPGKYFQKPGVHSEGFLENFSRLFSKFLISETFPWILQSHDPKSSKWSLEIFSRKPPQFWTDIFEGYLRLPTRFAVISCLAEPTRHLLMLHLFQLSSMVTSQKSKFFLEKCSRKPTDSCPDNLSIWVKLRFFEKLSGT